MFVAFKGYVESYQEIIGFMCVLVHILDFSVNQIPPLVNRFSGDIARAAENIHIVFAGGAVLY